MYEIYEIYNGAIITSVIFANYGPMTSKTQTSQLRVLFKTYTFDENSLRVALTFPIAFG